MAIAAVFIILMVNPVKDTPHEQMVFMSTSVKSIILFMVHGPVLASEL